MLAEQKATYYIQVFSSVKHGFALRGDPNVPAESKHSRTAALGSAVLCMMADVSAEWAKEESARAILDWFSHFCG